MCFVVNICHLILHLVGCTRGPGNNANKIWNLSLLVHFDTSTMRRTQDMHKKCMHRTNFCPTKVCHFSRFLQKCLNSSGVGVHAIIVWDVTINHLCTRRVDKVKFIALHLPYHPVSLSQYQS